MRPPDLPRLLVLTDRRQCRRPLVEVVRASVDAGCRAVVLREKDLPRSARAALAEQLQAALAPVGGVLLIASGPQLPGTGVHLAAADPLPAEPLPGVLVGRSCHGVDGLAAAAEAGCSYATLSPIHPTRSKPGYGPPLGPAALAASPLTTFALGGIDRPERAAACVAAGAHGVAVMGAVMRARRPDRVVAELQHAASDAAVTSRGRR